jgi:hypothetical protein
VLVGVHVVGQILHLLVQQCRRLRDALAVLAVDGAGFRLKIGFLITQVLEPVAFDLDDLLQAFLGEGQVIGRQVVCRERISAGAHRGRNLLVDRAGVLLGAAEHHVFEEVGEAGTSRFDFVPAAGPHYRPVRHEAGAVQRDDDRFESVRQDFLPDAVREDGLRVAEPRVDVFRLRFVGGRQPRRGQQGDQRHQEPDRRTVERTMRHG